MSGPVRRPLRRQLHSRDDQPALADWIAVVGGALGALMATLDISITNSALPQIQGEIGASGTEGTWIGTGYLVAEIVMIPLAAWLTRVFGLRILLLSHDDRCSRCSRCCAGSPQPAADDHRPRRPGLHRRRDDPDGADDRPHAPAAAPDADRHDHLRPDRAARARCSGPVLGGWLAENINWRWCFFLNLPVGIALVTLLTCRASRREGQIWHLFANADWLGILGMAIAFSCLTVVLEEGQRENWFDSSMIV